MERVFAAVGLLTLLTFLATCAPAATQDIADRALRQADQATRYSTELDYRILDLESRVDALEAAQRY